MPNEIKGDKETIKALLAVGDEKFASKQIRTAQRTGAKTVAEKMRTTVPVKTGFLKSQIKVRSGKRKKNHILTLAGNIPRGPAYYGTMQDRGWQSGGVKHPGTQWATKASEAVRQKVLKEFNRDLGIAIDKEVSKYVPKFI